MPPEEPGARPQTPDELVTSLENLYLESREFSQTFEPILERYVQFVQDDAEINDDDNDGEIEIPEEIARPYDEASAVIARLMQTHAVLIARWDAAGMPQELPHHGLPEGSHLAMRFAAQLPEPPAAHRARLEALFDSLHDRAQRIMDTGRRLDELTGLDDEPSDDLIDGLLDLERSYANLFHDRLALLREWDGAGFGQAAPPHGLEPVARFHFDNFEALDQQRLASIRAHAER